MDTGTAFLSRNTKAKIRRKINPKRLRETISVFIMDLKVIRVLSLLNHSCLMLEDRLESIFPQGPIAKRTTAWVSSGGQPSKKELGDRNFE